MMRTTSRLVGIVAAGATLLLGSALPSSAHKADLFTPHRAGPLRIDETTLKETKEWLGNPSKRRMVTVGCDVKLLRVKWGNYLKAYYGRRNKKRILTETWVRDRTISLEGLGDRTMHTRKGLRVGDKVKKMKNLYPRATKYRYEGRTWFELRPSLSDEGRIRAYVKNKRVVALTNPPYEYC